MKFHILTLLVSALAVIPTVISPASARAETVTLVADGWCPYNCEPTSDRPGFMVEIAKRAFEKHGLTVEYLNLPWARAIEDTRAGKYNAIIGAYYGDAPDFIFPEHPQGVSSFAFFVNKDDSWNYDGLNSLHNRSLGTINEYSYSQNLDAYILEHKNDPARVQILYGDNAIDNNIKKLVMHRVDTIIEDRQAMAYFLSPSEYESVRSSIREAGILPDDTDGHGAVFIAFSPQNPNSAKYAKILSDETLSMHRTGELQKIMKSYNLEPYDPEMLKK